MKKLILVFIILVCLAGAGGAAVLTDYLPGQANIIFRLYHLNSSPTWQDILGLVRDKLEQGKDSQQLILSYVLKQFKFTEIAGGYFKSGQLNNNILLLQPELEQPGEQFNKFLIANLGSFVAIDQNWHQQEVSVGKIYFDARGEGNDRLTSFVVQDNQVVLASNSKLVKSCLETKKRPAGNSWYRDLQEISLPDPDGTIWINNRDKNFAAELKKWEQENKMVVLLSAEWLDRLGLSFKFTGDNWLHGRIIFSCANPAKIALVKNDAEFLGEVAKRRYSGSQLDIKSKVTVNGARVVLDFDAVNWRPVLETELQTKSAGKKK